MYNAVSADPAAVAAFVYLSGKTWSLDSAAYLIYQSRRNQAGQLE